MIRKHETRLLIGQMLASVGLLLWSKKCSLLYALYIRRHFHYNFLQMSLRCFSNFARATWFSSQRIQWNNYQRRRISFWHNISENNSNSDFERRRQNGHGRSQRLTKITRVTDLSECSKSLIRDWLLWRACFERTNSSNLIQMGFMVEVQAYIDQFSPLFKEFWGGKWTLPAPKISQKEG